MSATDNAAGPKLPSFREMWAWSIGVWTAVWALFTLQMYVWYQGRGEAILPARVLTSFCEWMLWALLTPLLLWFVWRHPLTWATWKRSLPWQAAAAIVAPAVLVACAQLTRYALSHVLDTPDLYTSFTLSRYFAAWVYALFTYVDPILIGHALYYARVSRDQAVRRARLETRLAEAQLQVLRLQLHPHFLFNTLHTISALMHKDLRAADRMLALLGDLLRDSFERVGAQEVSLKQELGFLHRYLEIERTRFRDRLTVTLDVDPETLDASVPNLMLQPLVENAIRHGIGRRQDAGHIAIGARRDGDRLDLSIRDDGPGVPEGTETALRAGVGLANTAARLQQLYPNAHRFELKNRPEGGFEVALAIPFRPAAPASRVATSGTEARAMPVPLATEAAR
jgi:signal transduction histidine kinase